MGSKREKSRLLCVMQLPPPIHGVTVVNEQIARSTVLAESFDVEVIPLQFADTIAELGAVSLEKLGRASATLARLAWHLARHRPEAVYFTLSPQRPALYRDCMHIALAKAFAVRRIVHLHARPDPAARRALSWALHDAYVILLSPALRADLDDMVLDHRVRYVPNGIADRASPARTEHSTPRVLFLSNMLVDKGPLILVEALALLAERDVLFEATFAGAAAGDNCIAEFEAAVARHGLNGVVRYVGAVVGERKDPALFRDHDVFVLPTCRETFGLVLLEAMRAGLPIVSTREGAIPEIVRDGDTGFVVEPRDVRALTAKLEILLSDRGLRVRMGERGRAHFLEHYTLAHFEHQLAATLGEFVRA